MLEVNQVTLQFLTEFPLKYLAIEVDTKLCGRKRISHEVKLKHRAITSHLRNDQFQNRLEDSPPRTVPVMLAKSLQIEENSDSQDISRQKEDNGRKSVKIELLQGQEDEEKRNDSKSEGKKRESNAKFVKDPEQRLYYYIERPK